MLIVQVEVQIQSYLQALLNWLDQLCTYSPITQLSLCSAKIQELPTTFFDTSSLTTLTLDHNALLALPESINRLNHLEHLSLSNNQLVSIPFSLALPNLKTFNLSYNPNLILHWKFWVFYKDFCKVNLSGCNRKIHPNPLLEPLQRSTHDPTTSNPHSNTTYSKVISCENLKLYLQKIDAQSFLPNFIDTFMHYQSCLDYFSPLPFRIIYLDLSFNRIQSLPTSFNYLCSLNHLILHDNQLPYLAASFAEFGNLKHLDVSKNRITHIERECFFARTRPMCSCLIESLCSLNLRKNKLTTLPDTIKNCLHLDSINLEDNPKNHSECPSSKQSLFASGSMTSCTLPQADALKRQPSLSFFSPRASSEDSEDSLTELYI